MYSKTNCAMMRKQEINIHKPKNSNGFVRFNPSSYASGMYMVELYFEGMKVDQSKFIVVQ